MDSYGFLVIQRLLGQIAAGSWLHDKDDQPVGRHRDWASVCSLFSPAAHRLTRHVAIWPSVICWPIQEPII